MLRNPLVAFLVQWAASCCDQKFPFNEEVLTRKMTQAFWDKMQQDVSPPTAMTDLYFPLCFRYFPVYATQLGLSPSANVMLLVHCQVLFLAFKTPDEN